MHVSLDDNVSFRVLHNAERYHRLSIFVRDSRTKDLSRLQEEDRLLRDFYGIGDRYLRIKGQPRRPNGNFSVVNSPR